MMTGMFSIFAERRQLERFVLRGNVSHRRDRRLHDENVRAGFLGDCREALGLLRNGTDGGEHAGFLQFLNASAIKSSLIGSSVKLLNERGDFVLVGLDDFVRTSPDFRSASERLRD